MTENKLTGTARVANHSFLRAMYKDSKGDLKYINPTGKWNYLDLTQVQGVISGGGDTGGGDNPDHPSAGADYYAGSLADGEITERELLWQGESDPTKTTNATLLKDVGSKFNMAGDGVTILAHLVKTVMTAGVKGDTSTIPLNYDLNNVNKEGYFTTTSTYPIYIRAADLASKQELDIPFNGIGENLGGKNSKAPELHIQFKDDKTIDISQITGYDNDGEDSGATGANYDVVVEVVSTFSTQKAVAQLPASINLFTGSASGDIALSGSSDYYENVMDGLEITLDGYLYSSTTISTMELGRIPISNIGIDNVFRIPKKCLIDGYINNFDVKDSSNIFKGIQGMSSGGNGSWRDLQSLPYIRFKSNGGTKCKISKQGLNLQLSIFTLNSDNSGNTFTAKVIKVTPYKE